MSQPQHAPEDDCKPDSPAPTSAEAMRPNTEVPEPAKSHCERPCCRYLAFREEHGQLTAAEFDELEVPSTFLDALTELTASGSREYTRQLISSGELRILWDGVDWFIPHDWQNRPCAPDSGLHR